MSVRLYVGNLSFRLTADEVGAAFSEVVPVESVYLPVDRQTGRPRGYGFVEVAATADADAAIEALNGRPLLGRPIVVHHARPRQPQRSSFAERRRDDHPSHRRGPGQAHQRAR